MRHIFFISKAMSGSSFNSCIAYKISMTFYENFRVSYFDINGGVVLVENVSCLGHFSSQRFCHVLACIIVFSRACLTTSISTDLQLFMQTTDTLVSVLFHYVYYDPAFFFVLNAMCMAN